MRLKKRGNLNAASRNRAADRPLPQDEEKSLMGSARVPAPTRRAETPPTQQPAPDEGRIIRRQEYAPTYQVGRRYTATAQGKPPARSAYAGAAGRSAAAAVAAPARPKSTRPLLLISAAVCVLALSAAGVFGALTLSQKPALAAGEKVFFNGRMLCIAKSQDAVQQAYDKIISDLRDSFGMDVAKSDKLTFAPVHCDGKNILGDKEIAAALKANIDAKVVAAVIMVNERPAVALRTPQEAQQALDTILNPYRSAPAQLYRADVRFVEDVKVEQVPTDYSLVQTMDNAIRTLTLGANVDDNVYTVKKGDSLGKIAKKFTLKISDIRAANPSLAANDVIQPGQTLNAVRPDNWVSVRYTDTVTRQETLPYETVEQSSETMYTTQKEVKQKGKNGQREVVAKVTYINGMEAQKDIISQTVIEAAQNEIVLKGTKKVPSNAGSSGGGSGSVSGGYIRPLKSYTLTSTFKKRTLNGVTRWHYGVDLAAPKGTPIYAAKGGTVSYSGSASGYGQLIKIDVGGGVENRYGHMSKILVKKGQKVSQGQIIALVGATGDSTGPHLHFEIRINGTPVDPQKYVKVEADMPDWAWLEDRRYFIGF